jgi:hypothetical protein
VTKLEHTCRFPSARSKPAPCLACDIEAIGDRLAGPGAGASLDALDRIAGALAARAVSVAAVLDELQREAGRGDAQDSGDNLYEAMARMRARAGGGEQDTGVNWDRGRL